MFRRGLSTVDRPCVDQKVCNQLPVFLFQIQEDIGRAAQCMQDQNELGIPQLSPNFAGKIQNGFSFFRGIPQVMPKSYQKYSKSIQIYPKLIGFWTSEIQPLVPLLLICKDHTRAADFNGALARLTVLVVRGISILYLRVVFCAK